MQTLSLLPRISVAALASFFVGGCATSYAPPAGLLGATPEQVITQLGPPLPQPESLAQIRRLDFPRGPYGRHTYVVYFSADGKAERFEQVLKEENFARIKPGMDIAEVREIIGISRDTFLLGRDRGFVWNYRYITPLCQWFQIEFTKEAQVRSTGFGLPPECRKPAFAIR